MQNIFHKEHYILKYWKLNSGADSYFVLMEQEEESIQLRRVILKINLLKLKHLFPLYFSQATQCPERIHYEKNVILSFEILLWKELMRKQIRK